MNKNYVGTYRVI